MWRKRIKRGKQKEGRERREGRTRIERIGVPWAVKASTGTSAHIAARRPATKINSSLGRNKGNKLVSLRAVHSR